MRDLKSSACERPVRRRWTGQPVTFGYTEKGGMGIISGMSDILEELFWSSFQKFLSVDRGLIIRNVSERALCARLAIYLECLKGRFGLDAYHADVEYNRNQDRIKTIIDGEAQVIAITCDLLLHSRAAIVGRDNLIAIEMKKADRPHAGKETDRKRLRVMTGPNDHAATLPEHVCGYELGIFIEMDALGETFSVETFRNGESVASRRDQF
jgi:hypothetical protein